jgi:hypothetical protein
LVFVLILFFFRLLGANYLMDNKGKSVPIKIGIDTAAKKAGQWLQKAEERSGLRTLDKLSRAVCEWSKGGGQESLRHEGVGRHM